MDIYNPFTASVWIQHARRESAFSDLECEVEDLEGHNDWDELASEQERLEVRLNKLEAECARVIKEAEAEWAVVPHVFEDLHCSVLYLLEEKLYGVCIQHNIDCLGFNESDNDALREGY